MAPATTGALESLLTNFNFAIPPSRFACGARRVIEWWRLKGPVQSRGRSKSSPSAIGLHPSRDFGFGHVRRVHSIAWCVIASGSRPANSQPTAAANAGMPRRIRRRSATGMFPSAAIPPFSELLRSQPIMPT